MFFWCINVDLIKIILLLNTFITYAKIYYLCEKIVAAVGSVTTNMLGRIQEELEYCMYQSVQDHQWCNYRSDQTHKKNLTIYSKGYFRRNLPFFRSMIGIKEQENLSYNVQERFLSIVCILYFQKRFFNEKLLSSEL